MRIRERPVLSDNSATVEPVSSMAATIRATCGSRSETSATKRIRLSFSGTNSCRAFRSSTSRIASIMSKLVGIVPFPSSMAPGSKANVPSGIVSSSARASSPQKSRNEASMIISSQKVILPLSAPQVMRSTPSFLVWLKIRRIVGSDRSLNLIEPLTIVMKNPPCVSAAAVRRSRRERSEGGSRSWARTS